MVNDQLLLEKTKNHFLELYKILYPNHVLTVEKLSKDISEKIFSKI
jgi:acyl-coenzyme A synthetase/AMP-(fatty) acid ligase